MKTQQERLLRFLKDRKLSQTSIQEKAGKKNGYIRTTSNYSFDFLERLYEITNINLHWLITGQGDETIKVKDNNWDKKNKEIEMMEIEIISDLKEIRDYQRKEIKELKAYIRSLEEELSQYKPKSTKHVSQ